MLRAVPSHTPNSSSKMPIGIDPSASGTNNCRVRPHDLDLTAGEHSSDQSALVADTGYVGGSRMASRQKGGITELEVSTVIDRPVSTVWDFYAVHHVENHPRWDPTLELEAESEKPIGVGTVIKRRATRFGKTTQGTMEVVEFQPEKVMRVKTQDGPMTINGWVLFEALEGSKTKLVLGGDFPGLDDSMEEKLRPMMERSASNIRSLIESET